MLFRFALVFGLTTAFACASPYRKETLGTAPVSLGGQAGGVQVAASHDQFEVRYFVTTPRAMQLQYAIRCPGGERKGSIGETFEHYRERRLRELQAARQREVNAKASLVNAAVGQVQGSGQAQVGPVRGEASAEVDGAAAGQLVGEATTQEVQLPEWDLGAQSLRQKVLLPGGAAGACSMTLWSEIAEQDLSGVTGEIEVVHLVDKAREKRAHQVAASQRALVIRGDVKARLIASGADVQYRAKQKAAREHKQRVRKERELRERRERERIARESYQARQVEARKQEAIDARKEREHRRKLGVYVGSSAGMPGPPKRRTQRRAPKYAEPEFSAEAKLELQKVHNRKKLQVNAALVTRSRLISQCKGNGADPYHRARLRQARFDREQAEALERERKLQIKLEAEKKERVVRERQLALDLRTRQELSVWLIATGADPDYRKKKDMADLLAFEERTRDARYAQLRADANAEVSTEVSVEGEPPAAKTIIVSSSVARPPRPAAPQETRPARPHAQASWIAGFYEWRANVWVWVPGTWSTPPAANAIWVPTVEIQLGGKIVTQPGSWRTRTGRRVKRTRSKRPRGHDHR
jgi:hypothetical protein